MVYILFLLFLSWEFYFFLQGGTVQGTASRWPAWIATSLCSDPLLSRIKVIWTQASHFTAVDLMRRLLRDPWVGSTCSTDTLGVRVQASYWPALGALRGYESPQLVPLRAPPVCTHSLCSLWKGLPTSHLYLSLSVCSFLSLCFSACLSLYPCSPHLSSLLLFLSPEVCLPTFAPSFYVPLPLIKPLYLNSISGRLSLSLVDIFLNDNIGHRLWGSFTSEAGQSNIVCDSIKLPQMLYNLKFMNC